MSKRTKIELRRKAKGQAIVEYIIIIVIVALAALAVLGMFSDTIREKIGGATATLGTKKDVNSAVEKSSVETLKELDKGGIEITE